MSVTDVSYFDAWHRWFSGENVANYHLWMFQIVWWGRVGKLVSFISALTVIAELIGAERIRGFGESLHGRFTFGQAMQIVKAGFRPMSLVLKSKYRILFGFKRKADDSTVAPPYRVLMDEFFRTKIGFGSVVVVSLTTIVTAYIVFKLYGLPGAIAFFFVFSYAYSVILPFMVALLVTFLMTTFVCMDLLFIEPAAWLLERRSLDKLIKIGALTLLIIGFHFDLLAS